MPRGTRACGSGCWRPFGGCPTGPTPPFTSRRPSPFRRWRRLPVARPRGVGTVDVFLATAAGLPDSGLLEQVAAHLEERREIAVDVQVKAPEVRTVDVSVQVAARPGADFNTVRQAVESAVRGWFDGRLLGQSVLRAQLGALIFGVEGVENYALTAPAADVAAAVDELPQLGTLTVAALEGTA